MLVRPGHDRPRAPAGPALAECAGRARTVGRFAASTCPGAGRTSGTTPAAVRARHRPAPACSTCTGRSAACRPAAAHIAHVAGGAHWRARTLRKWRSYPIRCAPGCGASGVRWNLAARPASHVAVAPPVAATPYAAPTANRSRPTPAAESARRPGRVHRLATGDTDVGTVRVGPWSAPIGWVVSSYCAATALIPVKPSPSAVLSGKLSGYESCGPPPPFAAPLVPRCALTSGATPRDVLPPRCAGVRPLRSRPTGI